MAGLRRGIIGVPGFLHLAVAQLFVHGGEDIRDEDSLGAALCAVMAGGAGDGGGFAQDPLSMLDDMLFLFVQGLEVFHIGEVVLHLRYVGHTGQDGDDPVQGSHKADGPGGAGHVRMVRPEEVFDFLRRVGQGAAFYRFHDGDGNTVFPGNLIVRPGGDGRVLPVGIVNLQLDKVHLRMGGQELIQEVRTRVEGKAHVLDEALGFLLLGEVPQVELIIPGIVVFHQGMEQVVIEIFRAGALQADLELLFGRLFRGRHGSVDLGGQGIAFPGIAFHQRLAGGVFRSQVDIGGIKIGEPGFQEQIYHLLHLFHIDAQAFPGQAHEAESQLGRILSEVIRHSFHLRRQSRLFIFHGNTIV